MRRPGVIVQGRYHDQGVLFLARHGANHAFLPGEVNYRANIFALKQLGARRVVGISASGSLRQELKPGELALVDQYFDHTRGQRAYSFFGQGVVAHVSTAYPACPSLSADIARRRNAAANRFIWLKPMVVWKALGWELERKVSFCVMQLDAIWLA